MGKIEIKAIILIINDKDIVYLFQTNINFCYLTNKNN